MKILIFSAGFFPGKKCGGPPVSVNNFCSLMCKEECYIVATDHDMGERKRYKDIQPGWNIRSNAKVLYLSDKEFKSISVIDKIIKEISPDWLYFQSFFQSCVFPGLIIAKRNNKKVLLAPRGELCTGAFKKKYKKIPYILIMRFLGLLNRIEFQSTSDEETNAIKNRLHINQNKIHLLSNIPSVPIKEYIHAYKRSHTAKLVFLSRIHPKKNLLFAIQCLSKIEGCVFFDIYGPIEDMDYWRKCKSVITELPVNISVHYCGLSDHDNVHSIFSKYDAFLFPTLSENYGHVIAESLSVGTPVIVSNQTPWNDIGKYNAGLAVPLSEQKLFTQYIQRIVDNNQEEQAYLECNAKELFNMKYKIDIIKQEYYKVFSQ